MCLRTLIVFCIWYFSSTVIAQNPEILSVQDAIQIALMHNRTVQSARLDVEKSSDRVSAVKTRLLPVISFNALASRLVSPFSLSFDKGIFGDFPDIGPVPAEDTKVSTESNWTAYIVGSVQQPLSQIYSVKLNQALLESSREESKEKEREGKAKHHQSSQESLLRDPSISELRPLFRGRNQSLQRIEAGHRRLCRSKGCFKIRRDGGQCPSGQSRIRQPRGAESGRRSNGATECLAWTRYSNQVHSLAGC